MTERTDAGEFCHPLIAEGDAELNQLLRWIAEGQRTALATVVSTWGSSPRPVGSQLAIAEGGAFAGSVSGGCIEGAVVTEALDLIRESGSRLLTFGVSDEEAWEVGLSCGGAIEVFVTAITDSELLERLAVDIAGRADVAMVTRIDDGSTGLLGVDDGGDPGLNGGDVADQALGLLRAGRSGLLETASGRYFVRSYVPAPRLMIVGAVHIAQALAAIARTTGYRVTVIDPRAAFARADKFPGAELIRDWPDQALGGLGLDSGTAVVTLAHDPKIDDPALEAALDSPAFYVGALGSKRTHARRLERLAARGLEAEAGRIHGPVGLDLGGRSHGEIAVAIMAEIIRARYQR